MQAARASSATTRHGAGLMRAAAPRGVCARGVAAVPAQRACARRAGPTLPTSRLAATITTTTTKARRSITAAAVTGDMLEPSVFNKPTVRLAAIAAAVVLSAGSSFGGPAAATAAHVLAWATQFGTTVYTTFFAGILMFKNLPRQTFGRLQSHLFPAYFSILAGALAVQALTLWLCPSFGLAPKQAVTLGVGLAATLGNLLVAEPAATASMFKRYALENAGGGARDEAAISALKKEFGKLHGASSLLNLAALVACVAHGTWLAGLVSLPGGGAVLKLG